MPFDDTTRHLESLEEFSQSLGEMCAIIESYDIELAFMLGDFNAQPDTGFVRNL